MSINGCQSQKDKSCMNPLTWGPRQSESQRQKVGWCLLEAEGGGTGELVFNGHRLSVWEDDQVLKMDSGDGCTTWMYLMPRTVHSRVFYRMKHKCPPLTLSPMSDPGPGDHAGTPPMTPSLPALTKPVPLSRRPGPWRTLMISSWGPDQAWPYLTWTRKPQHRPKQSVQDNSVQG